MYKLFACVLKVPVGRPSCREPTILGRAGVEWYGINPRCEWEVSQEPLMSYGSGLTVGDIGISNDTLRAEHVN